LRQVAQVARNRFVLLSHGYVPGESKPCPIPALSGVGVVRGGEHDGAGSHPSGGFRPRLVCS
jgi:hypothetical protein